jgi:hypothetical protein
MFQRIAQGLSFLGAFAFACACCCAHEGPDPRASWLFDADFLDGNVLKGSSRAKR